MRYLRTSIIALVALALAALPLRAAETIKVLGQAYLAAEAASVTCTNASPMVCTWTSNTLANGDQFFFSSGTPPTGGPTWALNTIYWVVGISGNTFNLATTLGGSAGNSTSTGSALIGNSYKLLYAPASATSSVVSTITISNNSGSADTVRIAVVPAANTGSGVATASKHFVGYGINVPATDTIIMTLGVTLAANDSIFVYSLNGTSAFAAFGSEIQ